MAGKCQVKISIKPLINSIQSNGRYNYQNITVIKLNWKDLTDSFKMLIMKSAGQRIL